MAKKNSRPNLADRKSASKKAEEKKLAERKAYWDAHKKQILTIAAIVIAAIVVLSAATPPVMVELKYWLRMKVS